MELGLNGRVAVVTGGARGIGAAIARELALEGCHAVVADRDDAAADATAGRLAGEGLSALAEPLDVSVEDSVQALVASVLRRWGRLDILVNNAGLTRPAPVAELERASWDQVVAVNLTGPFLCAKHALAPMREAGWGRIVTMSSFNGKSAPLFGDNASYAATKAGVIGLTHDLALEAAPHGITVNGVAPSIVDTDLLRGAHDAETRRGLIDRVPLKRFATPEEIAGLVTYLASERAGYITGEVVSINGGIYMD